MSSVITDTSNIPTIVIITGNSGSNHVEKKELKKSNNADFRDIELPGVIVDISEEASVAYNQEISAKIEKEINNLCLDFDNYGLCSAAKQGSAHLLNAINIAEENIRISSAKSEYSATLPIKIYDDTLSVAATKGDIESLNIILDRAIVDRDYIGKAIKNASKFGRSESLSILLERFHQDEPIDSNSYDNMVFAGLIRDSLTEVVMNSDSISLNILLNKLKEITAHSWRAEHIILDESIPEAIKNNDINSINLLLDALFFMNGSEHGYPFSIRKSLSYFIGNGKENIIEGAFQKIAFYTKNVLNDPEDFKKNSFIHDSFIETIRSKKEKIVNSFLEHFDVNNDLMWRGLLAAIGEQSKGITKNFLNKINPEPKNYIAINDPPINQAICSMVRFSDLDNLLLALERGLDIAHQELYLMKYSGYNSIFDNIYTNYKIPPSELKELLQQRELRVFAARLASTGLPSDLSEDKNPIFEWLKSIENIGRSASLSNERQQILEYPISLENFSERLSGLIQWLGGSLELAGALLAGSSCGVGAPTCATAPILAAAGWDNLYTGYQTFITGESQSTVGGQLLQRLGLSSEAAEALYSALQLSPLAVETLLIRKLTITAATSQSEKFDRLVANGGLFSRDGNPLMNFNDLTNAQKGIVGEIMGGEKIIQLFPDAQRIGRSPGIGENGIDDLYKLTHKDIDYLVVEYKFGSSSLRNTMDGLQMSDSWLTGVNTGKNRLIESLGDNRAEARGIRKSFESGRVEKWLVHTDPFGRVTAGVLDKHGKFISEPDKFSKIIGDIK